MGCFSSAVISTRFTGTRAADQAPRPATPSSSPTTPRPGIRAQILETAVVEFAEKGFQDASLASIARKLGVTAPLVLYHFGSKANLWREAVEILCAGLASVVEAAIEDGRNLDGRSALRLVVRRLVFFFDANRSAYRLLRDSGDAEASDRGEWLARKHLQPLVKRIEAVYFRAVGEGSVRPASFETTLFLILGAASCYFESRGLAANLFGTTERSADWIDRYAEEVVDFCFRGLTTDKSFAVGAETVLFAIS